MLVFTKFLLQRYSLTSDHYVFTGSCLWQCALCLSTLLGWEAGETQTDGISSMFLQHFSISLINHQIGFGFILLLPGISTEWNTLPGVRSCRQESANSGRSCYCDDWYPPSVQRSRSMNSCCFQFG